MQPLDHGAQAPPVPWARLDGATALLFYKVTCPTCQVAAPAAERLHQAAPERFVAVAQDPPERIEEFARAYGTTFESIPDTEPYELSNAYGVRTVPTLFVVNGDRVEDVVESWDREGWNRAAAFLGRLAGASLPAVSEEGDGLPPFRPG